MTDARCEECGEELPARATSCPNCGAELETTAQAGDPDEFEELTEDLRSDQWKTYVVLVTALVVGSAGIVYLMLQGFIVDMEKFRSDGPRYKSNVPGMKQYMLNEVVPSLESRGDAGKEVDCTVEDVGQTGTDRYRAKVTCENDGEIDRGTVTIDYTGYQPTWTTTLSGAAH